MARTDPPGEKGTVANLADELKIVIRRGLRSQDLQVRAAKMPTLFSLRCVVGAADSPEPLFRRSERVVKVLRLVLKDSSMEPRLRDGLEMWFGATPELALRSAPSRREDGFRRINPGVELSGLLMSSKTILERHEPKYRELVADRLAKYEERFAGSDQGYAAD